MSKFTIIFFFLIACLLQSSCSSSSENSSFIFGKGKYRFTMSDSSGTTLLDGVLTVKSYEKDQITGTYTFTKIHDDGFAGFTSMSGEFSGSVNSAEKIVFINTNPKVADSNVFWKMKIKKSGLFGNWNYSIFRGASFGGLVKVTKY